MNDLYIIGAGGHGTVVAELADLIGLKIAGFVDDDPALAGERILHWTVIGGRNVIPDGADVAFGVGSNEVRRSLLAEAELKGWSLPVLIHPSAAVSPSAELGEATIVLAQSAVCTRAVVGRAGILNTACSIDHDTTLGEAVHIASGAHLGGGTEVGDVSLIGVGASVRPYVKVGRECVIGVGSAVVRDMPDGVTAYGNPARIVPGREA